MNHCVPRWVRGFLGSGAGDNEELLLPDALRAISKAAETVGGEVEVVVVANRCTDATAEIARGRARLSSRTSCGTSRPCAACRSLPRAASSTASATGTCSRWRCSSARSARVAKGTSTAWVDRCFFDFNP